MLNIDISKLDYLRIDCFYCEEFHTLEEARNAVDISDFESKDNLTRL